MQLLIANERLTMDSLMAIANALPKHAYLDLHGCQIDNWDGNRLPKDGPTFFVSGCLCVGAEESVGINIDTSYRQSNGLAEDAP